MGKLRYYWLHYFWGSAPYTSITKVNKDGSFEFSELNRIEKWLQKRQHNQSRLIRHRWHKWINPTPREDYPEISRVECKRCHTFAYLPTTKEEKES